MPDPISTIRHDYVPPAHHGGERSLKDIKYIVVHASEGGTAESVGAWFKNPASAGSTHYGVDDNSTQQYAPLTLICWGAPPKNSDGVHIEFCGYTKWTMSQWMEHKAELDRGAYVLSLVSRQVNVPLVHLTTADLMSGKKRGIITHEQVSAVWHKSSHTDPGIGFPLSYVITKASEWSDGPTTQVRATSDCNAYNRRTRLSSVAFRVKAGESLVLLGSSGNWRKVRSSRGSVGWVDGKWVR